MARLDINDTLGELKFLYDIDVQRVSVPESTVHGVGVILEGFPRMFHKQLKMRGYTLLHSYEGSESCMGIEPCSLWELPNEAMFEPALFEPEGDGTYGTYLDLRKSGKPFRTISSSVQNRLFAEFDKALAGTRG
jgi:hypothetical protein